MAVKNDKKTKNALLKAQYDEINSYHIYKKLAGVIKSSHNAEILNNIAQEEKKHYDLIKGITGKDIKPNKLKIYFYFFLLRFFGLTFGIRLMERGEDEAQSIYSDIAEIFPAIGIIIKDEEKHETQLIDMLDEELLEYISSIVLGLSDALVELTGALAGFTLALQNAQLIAIIGFITGISAALSMGASEFLSTSEEEKTSKSPFKAAIYTGSAYLLTVFILITPYLLIKNNASISLILSLSLAVLIIFIFTYYVSVAKSLSFRQRFVKITGLSLGIALISLFIGLGVKLIFHIDI